jgi:hypothetical protein
MAGRVPDGGVLADDGDDPGFESQASPHAAEFACLFNRKDAAP